MIDYATWIDDGVRFASLIHNGTGSTSYIQDEWGGRWGIAWSVGSLHAVEQLNYNGWRCGEYWDKEGMLYLSFAGERFSDGCGGYLEATHKEGWVLR